MKSGLAGCGFLAGDPALLALECGDLGSDELSQGIRSADALGVADAPERFPHLRIETEDAVRGLVVGAFGCHGNTIARAYALGPLTGGAHGRGVGGGRADHASILHRHETTPAVDTSGSVVHMQQATPTTCPDEHLSMQSPSAPETVATARSVLPYYADDQVTLLLGDAIETLRTLPDGSVDCCVTSPPYFGLRDYGIDGQYGLEASPAQYVETMRQVFAEVRRVLAKDGTCWINLGDSYVSPGGQTDKTAPDRLKGHPSVRLNGRPPRANASIPAKNLLMIPARIALALQDDGWILRNDIIWHKPNAMPESVTDRLSTRYEHVFMLTQSGRYWFDLDAIREAPNPGQSGKSWAERRAAGAPKRHGLAGAAAAKDRGFAAGEGGRNPGDVWDGARHPETDYRLDRDHDAAHSLGRNPGDLWRITTKPYPKAHFAVMPIDLPIRCIKAGCKPGGTVLDPFSGSGTTGEAARRLGRKYVGIDLNPEYHDLAVKRFAQGVIDLEIDPGAA